MKLDDFPYHVKIPSSEDSDDLSDVKIAQERRQWILALSPGSERKETAFGWALGEEGVSIFRRPNDPWHYAFKSLKRAVEFKLRFG